MSQIKIKKRKNALIRVRLMVTKSFDHLLNKFNSLNTMLRKTKKTRIFNDDVHMINFFSCCGGDYKRPSTTASPVVLS